MTIERPDGGTSPLIGQCADGSIPLPARGAFQGDGRRAVDTNPVATCLVFHCRRQARNVDVPCDDPEAELRSLLDVGKITTTHRCPDGALALVDLVGCGPGRAWGNPEAVTRERSIP